MTRNTIIASRVKAAPSDRIKDHSAMRRAPLYILLFLLLAIGGGGAFLATWEIPAPLREVEKVLPDDRFPR